MIAAVVAYFAFGLDDAWYASVVGIVAAIAWIAGLIQSFRCLGKLIFVGWGCRLALHRHSSGSADFEFLAACASSSSVGAVIQMPRSKWGSLDAGDCPSEQMKMAR
jgi:hypothetical protein